ncbi:MAG: diguanylate cyclase [Gammaproteobacteria bacterium]|nr:diguanylate cyclase [Gammaproteobacteria bacterium]
MKQHIEAKFDELKASGKMPSPKGVALAILRLAKKSDVTIDEFANVVKTDPSLSGNIIKAANSERSFYSRPIASVQVAVQRLGMATVKSLALGFSLIDSYRKGGCRGFDYSHYWAEQLLRAIAIREIAIRTRVAPSEDLFSVALLGEIGRLALATIYPEEYARTLDESHHTAMSLAELETKTFYIDHDELTRYILRDWGLPDILVETQLTGISSRDKPDSRQFQLGMSYEVARDIARLGMAKASDKSVQLDLDSKLAAVGMSDVGKEDLVENILAEWQEWSHSFGLDSIKVSFEHISNTEQDELAVPVTEVDGTAVDLTGEQVLNVLIVDDDADTREYMKLCLGASHFRLYTAENGEDALSKLVDIDPDIIISDWMMPELDGLGLCRVVRQSSEYGGAYFILMTADDTHDKLIDAFNSGVDDYIAKPFSRELLLARLRPGVRITQMSKQNQAGKYRIEKLANELAIVNRKLSLSSLTDPLTKLPNRRYALKRLEQEWATSQRGQRDLSCMMIDIDYFKVVNDTYGHAGGDLVLKGLAKILKGLLRNNDVACRMGGEEFMVICPDTNMENAVKVAERICEAIERTVFPYGDKAIHITLSIGVSIRENGHSHLDEMISNADKRLYEAKAAGRNLVM